MDEFFNYEVAYTPNPKEDSQIWTVSVFAESRKVSDAEMSRRYPANTGSATYSFKYYGSFQQPHSLAETVIHCK